MFLYFIISGNGINQVKTVTGFSGETKAFTYDTFGRTLTETDVIDGISFVNTYTYDQYSNLLTVKYPSDLLITRTYDANGYLSTIKNGSTTIFENTSKNALGQYTAYVLGGNQEVIKTYNQYGVPLNFKANSGVIQNLSFEFELKTGNLTRRTDHRKGKYEYFTYDDINRLTSAQTGNIGAALSGALQSYTFADNGNITSKTDIGAYKYDPVKLHAVVEVENTTAVIPTISQFITYSAFQQPMTITEGTNVLTYTYSADYQRIKGVLSGNAGVVLNKRYYFGDFERDITGAVTRDIHYIGGDGLNCIIEKVGTNVSYYYVYKDYLGSILTVTNSTGTIVEEKNYDAWGKNRNATDWTYANIPVASLTWLTRGYTGHEHLVQFELINMNGRLYDPILGRMLSPDNYTQVGSQGYNRYTYAMNNPLKYTDPSGQIIAPIAPIAYLGAAIVGGIGNVWSNWSKIGGSWGAGIAYFASGAVGGVVGLHNAHLGSSLTAIGNVGIDLATGHLPQIQNTEQFIAYAAKEVGLAIITTAAAQIVGKGLSDIAKNWKWFERGYTIAGGGLSATEIKELGGLLQPSIILDDAAAISARKGIEEFTEFEISQAGQRLIRGAGPDKLLDDEFDTGLKHFFGTEKAWQSGATPNSMYSYLSKDGKAVSNYIYNEEGNVIFQVDFGKHGNFLSGHGHEMLIPGNLGSGHTTHIPWNDVNTDFFKIPIGTQYSRLPGQ